MNKKEEEKRHKARRKSIKEGIFATAQASFGNQYLSPFAIAINASNSMVAMLGSLNGLLGPLSQLFSSRLIEKHSRKKIVLKAVFLESMMWIPLMIIALLFNAGLIKNALPIIFVVFFSLQIIATNMGGPAWFSWIGDLVDDNYRGRWFSKRNLILGFVSIILVILSSIFLDYFKKINLTMIGFVILFILAMFSRLASYKFMKEQYEPKIKLKKGYYFSFWDFLINAKQDNFGRFVLFRSFLAFAQSIAGPLIVVYLLRILKFNYTTYMIIIMAGTIFSIMLIELWGKFADKYGNYKTIIVSSFLIPIIPILWILSPSPIYLITVPSIIGGLAWAGFGLASGNFIYDNMPPEKRGLAVSYYNMLIGIGTFLGAGLGAILIAYIKTSVIQPIIIIFIISAILRAIAIMIGLPNIKEIRKTKKFYGRRALKNMVLKEAGPTLTEEAHQIMSIKKYLTED